MNQPLQPARVAAAACALAALSMSTAPAQEPEQGVLWETTAVAEVPGVPVKMPAYTTKYCAKEEWTKPPETSKDSSQNCRPTSFDRTPGQVKWTMACDTPPMTGTGEINFNGTDAYTGFVTLNAEDMTMQINLTGKKIGSCDDPE